MNWLRKKWLAFWREHQRRVDIAILWPACKSIAGDTNEARAAFYLHTLHDPAWCCLPDDEVHKRILELP